MACSQQASFKVRTAAFPSTSWYEFRKAFKAKPSNRAKHDPSGPPWHRIDGSGFTLWISDGDLYDSRTSPPIWEIRLEALATLNQAGQEYWQEVSEGIMRFIRAVGLEFIENSPGKPPSPPE